MDLRKKKMVSRYSLETRLIEDDRSFDLACVRSAVEFVNRVPDAEAVQAFAWLPKVLLRRAQRFQIPVSNVASTIRSSGIEKEEEIAHFFAVGVTLAQTRYKELAMAEAESDPKRREWALSYRKEEDEWLDMSLKSLPIYERVRFVDGRVLRVSLPMLRDVSTCVAFALLVIVENRWALECGGAVMARTRPTGIGLSKIGWTKRDASDAEHGGSFVPSSMRTLSISANGERDRPKNPSKQRGVSPQEAEMAIVRAPMKADPSGKCSRWRVILYNPATHKQEWHTIAGTLKQAKTFERAQQRRIGSGTYVPKIERRTFAEVAAMFLKEPEARARRPGTMGVYESVLRRHLIPEFGAREVGTIRRSDMADHFEAMRAKGSTVQTINRTLRTAKAVLFFAMERELVERNVLQRFRPFEGGKDERHVQRGAFSEAQLQALLAATLPSERALIGLLALSGLRPGEAYALDWSAIDLEAGNLRVLRSWDHRGKTFVPPKTKAGERMVPLSGWLAAELQAHSERTGGSGLVFATRNGRPLNPSNVRRDIWLPLTKRASVPAFDLYSLRHTFASLGRTAGESAFNVARMMGHARSTLVNTVYAHTMQSGMASVAENVTARALGVKPQLRVIEGRKPRDVREPLDEATPHDQKNVASV
jgi:integrase